jgi:ribosomal protein L29
MEKEKLSALNIDELKNEIAQLKKELFNLKLNASTMHLKDYSQFRKLRINIGQALTYLRQKELLSDGKQSASQLVSDRV